MQKAPEREESAPSTSKDTFLRSFERDEQEPSLGGGGEGQASL